MEPDQLPVDGIPRVRVGVEQSRGWLDASDPIQCQSNKMACHYAICLYSLNVGCQAHDFTIPIDFNRNMCDIAFIDIQVHELV